MIPVVLAVAGAVAWGSADFLGGLATVGRRALVVVGWSQAAGAIVLVPVAAAVGGRMTPDAVVVGVLAGLFTAMGATAYYRGLALGPMGVVAPVAAVVGALVPLVVATVMGERLSPLSAGGVGLALVAIVVAATSGTPGASRTGPAHSRWPGLLLAVVAGLGFGGFLVAVDAVPAQAGLWPLVVGRATATVAVLAVAAMTAGVPRSAAARPLPALVVTTGALDAAAGVAFVLARDGDLAVVGVLASLYPVVVVALAAVVLHERIGARLAVAAGAAVVGTVLVGLGGAAGSAV